MSIEERAREIEQQINDDFDTAGRNLDFLPSIIRRNVAAALRRSEEEATVGKISLWFRSKGNHHTADLIERGYWKSDSPKHTVEGQPSAPAPAQPESARDDAQVDS